MPSCHGRVHTSTLALLVLLLYLLDILSYRCALSVH